MPLPCPLLNHLKIDWQIIPRDVSTPRAIVIQEVEINIKKLSCLKFQNKMSLILNQIGRHKPDNLFVELEAWCNQQS